MPLLRKIFLIGFICVAAVNLCMAYGQALYQLQDRGSPLHSLSYAFMGLESVFKNVRYVGYYTDKDISQTLNIAQFEQAQYVLAPTVLELNHTPYHWAIFDCTSPQAAMTAMRHLGFSPLKVNRTIVLAFKPDGL